MAVWKIITLACTSFIIVNAKGIHHQKRDTSLNICDNHFNSTNKVQCYCTKDNKSPPLIRSADCYLTSSSVTIDDSSWSAFRTLGTVEKITFTNTRGTPFTYVPTLALKEIVAVSKLDIKYGTINTIGSFAFANLSSLEELTLRDNQIAILDPYAFIHHNDLKVISLDTNNIAEINRNVFVDLPALEKLYLTNNQISTIHDKAFIHLIKLKELEIDRNKIFSLNFAVFEGLKNLVNLDLSSNSLEVIGDNTFQALESLKSLNLEGNKIQILDDKAFNGLGKLVSLSVAHNALKYLDSNKIFDGLDSLTLLSLKGNEIKELRDTVLAPILSNFYGNTSILDVEENNFTCDCHLDWFVSLMNKTQNKYLRIAIENLKCMPDESLREAWAKVQEIEKTTQQALEEEEEPQAQIAEYEYYDDTQLNGKLFYVDVRDLLNCNKYFLNESASNNIKNDFTKKNTSLVTSTDNYSPTQVRNKESLNFEVVNTNPDTTELMNVEKDQREGNVVNREENFTTTRLATVSAKPIETKIYENMASDEAKPDKIKTHRSIQDERKGSEIIEKDFKANHANKNLDCFILLVIMLLCTRLQF